MQKNDWRFTRFVWLIITIFWYCLGIEAQRIKVFTPQICTPQIGIEGAWNTLPILTLNGDTRLTLSFDDMNTEAQRYIYRIDHCNEHFRPTENLFESSFLQATSNELLLENYEPSRNTVTPYNHYTLTIPNPDVRMLLPGNYTITVEQENEDGDREKMLQAYFMILDRKVNINAQVTSKTDIDFNHKHQQLTVEVNHSALKLHDPVNELKCVVIKNRDWRNAVWLDRPTMQSVGSLKWEHHRDLIFKAGNEYRKFENLSTETSSLHVDAIKWNATTNQYDVQLRIDEVRNNYLYDEDHNGAFLVRNTDNYADETESDYTAVHFTLQMPQLLDADVYVDGAWATSTNTDTYKMTYDEEQQCYKLSVWLKQGYYEYQYLSPQNQVEGDFCETENEYLILVYHQHPSERYTKLVGMGQIKK